MIRRLVLAALLVLLGNRADADTQPMRSASRGELLYSTHCVACHSTQVHWREKKLAVDWASLRSQVRRWQEMSGLGWNSEDIAEVARYLNALYYHYASEG